MIAVIPDYIELAHWNYDWGEWQGLIDREWADRKAGLRRQYLWFGAAFGAFALVVVGVGMASNGLAVGLLVLLAYAGAMAIAFGLPSWLAYKAAEPWYREARSAQPEVLITSEAVVYGGPAYIRTNKYRALTGFAQSLRVSIPTIEPTVLVFEITEHAMRGRMTRIRLPIPTGKENEAREVVDYFSWKNRAAREAASAEV